MAVTVTFKVGASNGNLGTNGSVTATGLTTSGASLILISASVGNNSSSTVSGVTVNGNAATLGKRQVMPDTFSNVEVWWWWSPAALSSVSVVVTYSNSAGAGTNIDICEATGTDASSIGNTGGANGTSATSAASAACSSSGSVMYASSLNFGSSGTEAAGTNTTLLNAQNDGAGDFAASSINNQATSSGTSYTVTTTHTSGQWAMSVVEVKPAGGGGPVATSGPPSIPPFLMRGPGRFRATGPRLRTLLFSQTAPPAGQMSATASISFAGSSTLTGSGSLAASAPIVFAGSCSIFPTYVLTTAANGRYLVLNGKPMMIKGRTAWGVSSLNAADLAEFLDDTVAHGYNAIEFQAPNHLAAILNNPQDGSGNLPFTNTLAGGTWSGTFPGNTGTSNPDLTTPNSAFWANADAIIAGCLSRGLLALDFAAYLGIGTSEGWQTVMTANGSTKTQAYGAFVANRYKAYPNIVWMTAGDTASGFTEELDLITGLQSVGGQASTNFSAERNGGSISSDGSGALGTAMTLNGAYDWATVIAQCRRAYAFGTTTRAIPAYMLEEPYDEEGSDGTGVNTTFATQPTRRYEWWGWMETIGGYVAGNGYIWPFQISGSPGTSQDNWKNHKNTQATQDLARLNAFVETIEWWRLIPSGQASMRTLIPSGSGAVDTATYISSVCHEAGTLLLAYSPPGGGGAFTVDLRSMVGRKLRARWWDPTAATFSTNVSADGTFSLSNTASAQSFTPPASNSAGNADFLLFIDAETAYGAVAASPFNVVGPGRRRSPAGAGKARSFVETVTVTTGAMSATASMTVGGSAAIAGAGALGATSAITAAGTASLVGGGALAASAGLTFAGSATVAGSGAAAATATITVGGTSALVGAGILAATSAITVGGTAAASGAAALVAAAAITFAGNATLTGAGAMVASATLTVAGSAVLAGAGALTGTPTIVFGGTANVGSGSISATGAMSFGGTAAAAGAGALAASSALIFAGSATAAGAGALAATAAATLAGNATLAGSAAASATAPILFAGTAALKGSGALAGIPTITFGGFANTGGQITAFVSFTFGGSAALTGAGAMVAVSTASFAGSAALGGSAPAAATGALTIVGIAQLGGAGALRATAALVFGGSATLTGASPNVGTIVFGGSGVLKGAAALAAMGTVIFGGTANIAGGAVLPPLAHVGSGGTKAGGSGGPTRAKRT